MLRDLRLTDGGLYDNLGLEPVWKDHEWVLVSDGGASFDVEADRGPFRRLWRYTVVQGGQVSALRKRWLISNYMSGELRGAYWGVRSKVSNYAGESTAPCGYSGKIVDEVIAEVRTDMDAFTEAEMNVLENHGYSMATVAVETHAPQLITSAPVSALTIPHPEWMEESRVREALKNSNRRQLFGRH